MTIIIRPTSADRLMIESDGFDQFHRAYAQGAAVCRISAPSALVHSYTDAVGSFDFPAFLADVRSYPPTQGVRIHALRWIQ